jgi:hypothetical protein
MLVSRTETSRPWGVKKPAELISRDKASKTVTYEADFWEGPCEAGLSGQYVRCRFTENESEACMNSSPSWSERDTILKWANV